MTIQEDCLGSARVVVRSDGAIRDQYKYYAFGSSDNEISYTQQSYHYTGKPIDREEGLELYYYGARWYDPELGRFLSLDPLASKYPGWSPYVYTLNNPLKFVDPNGLWSATYDDKNNVISVTAEEGDNLKGLYEQMGMTEEEFGEAFGIDDMSNYKVEAGNTSFDITQYVISNTSIDTDYTGSNCHGFVSYATGATSKEGSRGQTDVSGMTRTDSPTTGNIAVFNMQGTYQFKNQPQPVNASIIQGHAAIYIINNKDGAAQFLNRINTGQPVTINTQSQIIEFFANPNNALGGPNAYKILPKLNPNPTFYK